MLSRATSLLLVALGALSLPCAAQGPVAGTISRADVGQRGALRLGLYWGTMVVTGGDVSEIRYRIVRDLEGPKRDSLAQLPEGIPYHLTRDAQGVTLEMTERDAGTFVAGRLEVTVPRDLPLLRVRMERGGSITVSDFDGELEVINRNGDTRLLDLGGAATVEALNGSVVIGFHHVDARQAISVMARNGGITLNLPRAAQGTIVAETRSGRILANHPIDVTTGVEAGRAAEYRPRRATIRLGTGGPTIRLFTLSGDIEVRHPSLFVPK